jgi:hypothetical protein
VFITLVRKGRGGIVVKVGRQRFSTLRHGFPSKLRRGRGRLIIVVKSGRAARRRRSSSHVPERYQKIDIDRQSLIPPRVEGWHAPILKDQRGKD